MRLRHRCRPALLLLLLSACTAGATPRQPPLGAALQITVYNNLSEEPRMLIWIIPAAGSERRLGEVGPAETRTFRYEPTSPGSYRLRALEVGASVQEKVRAGRSVLPFTSELFLVSPGGAVDWNLRENRITVTEREGQQSYLGGIDSRPRPTL